MMGVLKTFAADLTQPLVWTLIHSLWQGLLIVAVLTLILRLIPARFSSVRYALAAGALAVMFVASLSTYFYLMPESSAVATETSAIRFTPHQPIDPASADLPGLLNNVIESNITIICLVWLSGVLFYLVRMASGFFFIASVRKNAVELDGEWNELLRRLSDNLELKRIVKLAESSQIDVPFVTGYFKPLVLIPTGMLSGLTADQLEAILIHELMHIRRHDYLVNIIQSCIEALMFFNPFAWMISSIIRNEREHCCDDEAVRHGNPLVYAHALATLEEYRLTKNDIALSLAQNKNQLLKRIKRIMERSAQHYSIRERMVPLLLLVIGLVCASWLSIKTAKGGDDHRHEETAADTTPKSKSKSRSATYSRKTVVTLDENGNPKTDVVESFDGDEELREAVGGFSWSIGEPVLPVEPMGPVEELAGFDMAGQFEMMPPVPEFDEHFDFAFEGFDTLPGVHFNGHDWEAFSEEFQAKFKDKFGDFYKKHGEEMAKMMAEMGAEFNMTFHEGDAETTNLRRHSDHEYDKSMAVMTEAAEQYERAAQEAMRQHEGAMEQHQRMAEQLARQTETQVKELERQTKIMEEKVKAFETEMMKQLANDGYMKKGDKLETLNWRGDHGIEVNGKMIRKSDVKKYQAIHDRFFGHRDEIRYVE